MTTRTEAIHDFWTWFSKSHRQFEELHSKGDLQGIATRLNPRLDRLDPELAWEIGPRKDGRMSLNLTAEGNPELRRLVDELVASAPRIEGWEFRGYRQPRTPPRVVHLTARDLQFSSETWEFHPIEQTDRLDLVILDDALASADREAALRACFIYLDALLGEEMVERWLGRIDIAFKQDSVGPTYPIDDLCDYLLWATNRSTDPLRPKKPTSPDSA